MYALFALGFTLVFGIHPLMNLAHGAVFMTGAFVAPYTERAGWPRWRGFLFALLTCGLLSVIIEWTAFRPLHKSGEAEFGAIVSTLGADLIIVSTAQNISASEVLRFPFDTFPVKIFKIAGLRLSLLQWFMSVCAFTLMLLLTHHLCRIPLGTRIRSVSGNYRAAVLCGVNLNVGYAQTFFLSGALAGASGVLIGLEFNSIQFAMAEPFRLRGFVVIVLGGMGSIPGAMVAGLLLGMVRALTAAYLPAGLTDAIIFTLLFLVLLLRPNGLFEMQAADMMRTTR